MSSYINFGGLKRNLKEVKGQNIGFLGVPANKSLLTGTCSVNDSNLIINPWAQSPQKKVSGNVEIIQFHGYEASNFLKTIICPQY